MSFSARDLAPAVNELLPRVTSSHHVTPVAVQSESASVVSHSRRTTPLMRWDAVEPVGDWYVKVKFFTKILSDLMATSSRLTIISVSMFGISGVSLRATQTFVLKSRVSLASSMSGPVALTTQRYVTLPLIRSPSLLSQWKGSISAMYGPVFRFAVQFTEAT